MDNMSVADYLAIADRKGDSGVWGGNAGFLWVILIFLFFLGFSGGGLFGRRNDVTTPLQLTAVERDVLNGTAESQREILESRYTTQLGMQAMQAQMASCCCETQKEIADIAAQAYKNTCEITSVVHEEGERTRALITANTIQELRDQLANAQNVISNTMQTQNLVNAIRPVPQPAYLTCSPYVSYNPYSANGCSGCGTLV